MVVRVRPTKPILKRSANRSAPTRMWSYEDLAEHYGVAPVTLRRWVRLGSHPQPLAFSPVTKRFTDEARIEFEERAREGRHE